MRQARVIDELDVPGSPDPGTRLTEGLHVLSLPKAVSWMGGGSPPSLRYGDASRETPTISEYHWPKVSNLCLSLDVPGSPDPGTR